MEDKLILVDRYDNPIGEEYKLETHKKALLHRAFSVFIMNGTKMLIQQRAFDKYHSGGLWANACCSHPRVNESLEEAVQRRMEEELGFSCSVQKVHEFTYFHEYNDGLCEYEYDHVFVGEYNGRVNFSKEEINQIKWIELEELEKDLRENPQKYSAWFHVAVTEVIKFLKK